MRWMIQDANVPLDALDQNGPLLLAEVQKRGLRWSAIKHVPFSHEIIGLGVDVSEPTIFWCSTQMAAQIAAMAGPQFYPGVFWKEGWWDPRTWLGKRSDLLNENIRTITVRELRDKWVEEPTFVKSVDVKGMTGDVLEPFKADKDNWIIELSELDGDQELVLSPPTRLLAEWRFFVVDGKVVTGSMYRKEGVKRRMLPVDPEVWAAADTAVKEWMPTPNVVIDLCLTEAGEYKVVEFNGLNTSGFYNSDIGKLVDALEAMYAKG